MIHKENSLGKKLLKTNDKIIFDNDEFKRNLIKKKNISSNNIILSRKKPNFPDIISTSVNPIKPQLKHLIYKSIFNSLRIDDYLNKTDDHFVNNTSNTNKDSSINNNNNKYNMNKYISNPQNQIGNIKVNKKILVNKTKTTNNYKSYIAQKKINDSYKKINNYSNKYNTIYRNGKDVMLNNIIDNKPDLIKKECNSIKEKTGFFRSMKEIEELNDLNDLNVLSINKNNSNIYKSKINLTEGNHINNEHCHYQTVVKEKNNSNNKYKFVNRNNIKLNLNNYKFYQTSFGSKNDDNIKSDRNYKYNTINSFNNNQLNFNNNKDMNKLKRRINSRGEVNNIYQLSENKIDQYTKKPRFVTLSAEKSDYKKTQKLEGTKNNNNNNNNNYNIMKNNLFYSDNLNLELKENIEQLKNELTEKNKIINNYIKIISDYKETISKLIEKNKKLADNSVNLLKQIEQYKQEIMILKNQNSILINNNINYNYNDENNKIIINLRQELEKYKIANNNLKSFMINNSKKDTNTTPRNKIYSLPHRPLYSNLDIDNEKYNKPKRKRIFSAKLYKEDI